MCYIYHIKPKLHTSQTLSFHNNLSYPPPYFGYPHWESVTLCKYQHYPTLDTYLSLSFNSDTLPEYQPYPTNCRKNTPPYIEYLPHLPHPRHLSLHTCTHLTLPFIGCWMFRTIFVSSCGCFVPGCFVPRRFVPLNFSSWDVTSHIHMSI